MAVLDPQPLDQLGSVLALLRELLAGLLAERGCQRIDLPNRRSHGVQSKQTPCDRTVTNVCLILAAMRGGELRERRLVDRVRRHDGHPNRRRCPDGRRALAALEQRALAEQGTGADLGHPVAVDLDVDNAVEQQEELPALLALGHQRLALLEVAPLELLALTHDRSRKLTLEVGLDRRRQRRRILLAPRRVLAVRGLVPLLEVDRPRLLHQLAAVVVEPVARERARSLERVLGGALSLDRQGQRRPRGGGLDPEERLAADPPRRGQAHVAAGGLLELDPAVADLGLRLEQRILHGRKRQLASPELDPGDA